MKKNEIKVGGLYTALVSGTLTVVRVDAIRDGAFDRIVYDVTNTRTGRKTTFRSAAKFRSVATVPTAKPITRPTGGQHTEAKTEYVSLAAKLAESAPKTKAPHLIIEARAGTGKTTTLIEGLKVMKGIGSKFTPSPQQKAVWDSMSLSADARTVCFVAFNRSIADELKSRVPAGCEAMTMHSMGFKAVTRAIGQVRIEANNVQDVIAEILGANVRDLRRDPAKMTVLSATSELVGLVKMNLVEPTTEELTKIVSHYEIETDRYRSEVFDLVPKVIERCKNPKGQIDFNDMIWLPVVLNLPITRYDLLLVDEAQDLNRCQQELAKRAGTRLILCGDPKQAIYGFAGADADSMPRMGRELPGCVVLPLTVTRRCGKAIVAEANRIVADFSAFETNPEGTISRAEFDSKSSNCYMARVQDRDMVLCRVNAPLVSQCFRFIKAGRKATIQGRDIGAGLISTVKKLSKDGCSVTELISRISDWSAKEVANEQAKKNPSEPRIIAIQDRADCLYCFTEGANDVAGVISKIESVFTDDKTSPGIRLSSIHKSKGLEATRVFLLQPEGATVPHPMAKSAWQREQEWNLKYVAITRAIEELCYVS